MNREGILAVISGFSGSGKGSIVKTLMEKHTEYGLSISATSRSPREGEENGREYFFLTRNEFESMIKNNELIEWTEYVGNYYGTPEKYVSEMRKQGKDVILEIEIQGALKIKQKFPEALLIFVTPPSAGELKQRLMNRGTETKEVISKRLNRALEEADTMEKYEYLVVNDILEECAETIHHLIQSQKYDTKNQTEFMNSIKQELKTLREGE